MSAQMVTRPETEVLGAATPKAEQFFDLGMMYSTGLSVPLDMVSAHKWFNLAAQSGMKGAIRLRNEVAGEMSQSEIAAAQRAARDWLRRRH
jgi:TPR repeat protein